MHSADTSAMTSKPSSDRKRNPAKMPETASSTDDQNPKASKARRVSTNPSASNAASRQVVTLVAKQEESIQRIGSLIQDLFHSDNAKVNAALDALTLDLDKDRKKHDKIQAVGGCFVLVQLLTKCVDKAIDSIRACDQLTKLNEFAELTTLYKTLYVIIDLTFQHIASRVGIAAICGVEAIVKVMQAFPKCQALQGRACGALLKLVSCNLGQAKAIESGGIEVLLAAINNHLDSPTVCELACWALSNIVDESKKNTKLLISLGGAAAVAKLREERPDDNGLQTQVRSLAKSIATEMNSWADEE
jgi:hypothetical protein